MKYCYYSEKNPELKCSGQIKCDFDNVTAICCFVCLTRTMCKNTCPGIIDKTGKKCETFIEK